MKTEVKKEMRKDFR